MALTPAGSTERTLDLGHGPLRVLSSVADPAPPGIPLLLVHGGGTDSAAISWYEAYSTFGPGRPVIAPDLPGFGGSTGVAPVGGPDALADVVAGVADRLGLRRVVVGGISMGGDVALQLALRRPDLVEALVLVAPGGLTPLLGNRALQFSSWLAAQLPDPVLVPLARIANRFARSALRRMVRNPEGLPAEVVDEFVREARRPRAGMGYARYNQATLGPRSMRNDLQPVVGRITVPALFLHGADDPMVDPGDSRRAAAAMPDARLVTLPGCGHWAQFEARERVAREVQEFLAGLDRRRDTAGARP